MKIVVDADSMIYSAGFAGDAQDDEMACSLWNLDAILRAVSEAINVRVADMEILLTASPNDANFRYTIDPEYKANRKDARKPRYYKELRDYAVAEYGAYVCAPEWEADDEVAMRCAAYGDDVVVVGIDKDLFQIPTTFYNWKHKMAFNVTPDEACRNFWVQVLEGDRADNIPGIPGVGPVKAKRIVDDVPVDRLEHVCRRTYLEHGLTEERFVRNCRLLYLLRHPEDWWDGTKG